MKQFKDIKNKLKWEKYYDPDFDWFDWTVNTFYMSMNNDISEDFEDFIREFKDKVDWTCISEYKKLSENFIREFKDKVWWEGIAKSQILSEEFKEEFKDKLY